MINKDLNIKTREEAIAWLRENGYEDYAIFLEQPDTPGFAEMRRKWDHAA